MDGRLARVHVATASGLLHASHLVPSTDYETLLRLTLRLTGDLRLGEAQMRRAVFNVLAHNRDDHTKQHSFTLRDGAWRLAPAYDLTFSTGAGGEHALTVGGRGTGISAEDLLRMGPRGRAAGGRRQHRCGAHGPGPLDGAGHRRRGPGGRGGPHRHAPRGRLSRPQPSGQGSARASRTAWLTTDVSP